MATQVRPAFSEVEISSGKRSLRGFADQLLNAAVRFWFAVTILGQLVFAFSTASYFGMAAIRGDSARAWSKHITHGYVPGDTLGNFAVMMHIISAVVVILAGILQLIPQIRERFPLFHRWNGRIYVVTAFTISVAGLYMTWVRGSVGDLAQHLGSTFMAVLIMVCAALAWRYALARDFIRHRQWALRLYLVVSASLFIRAGLFLSLILNRGPFGFDPATFSGPFLTFLTFAQYLVPLAILELYLRTKERGEAVSRIAMAAGLSVLTLALGAGVFAASVGIFLPSIKAAYDRREPIMETLSATIASSGIDAAAQLYHDLKNGAPAKYNFDEDELNTLGYQLLHTGKVTEAIRVFQLNIETYPRSSNAYDSLGEAYMDAGDKALAVANYQKSLQLNAKNRNASKMLEKLNAQ